MFKSCSGFFNPSASMVLSVLIKQTNMDNNYC